mgnify:CR=1 FL=1
MARNDGIDRTFARNQDLPTLDDVAKVQEHNEREKDSYSNQDIDTTQTHRNVHFKKPTDSYAAMFDQMIADGVISTRGLKADAVKYGELLFDVNSAYFHNHGGYEYAKQFYADAYKAAVEIVGGEQYILSAVMHADERNRAMSEALGEDVYHYHLHVVYIPVVEKQILWSKRCKDESLRGTVKETITQVSRSKKWESKPVLDENGNPMLNAKGKKILKSSYSVLQDDFFNFMRNAGYTDVERGECGSTEEHLHNVPFALADDGVLVYTAILDVSQQNIAIIGAYGSGKTNLLLHCARWLYDTGCANIRFTRKTEHGMVTDDGKPLPSHKRTIWIVDDADEALNPFSSAPEANELREALVNPNITVIAAVEKPISALLDRCPTRVAFPCGERSNDLMLGIPGAILDGFAADDYTLPGRGVLMQQAKACPIQCVEFQGF